MYPSHIRERAYRAADMVVEEDLTIREIAKKLFVSRSCIHLDLSHRLPKLDPARYFEVQSILTRHYVEKHVKGGEKTRERYQRVRGLL